MALDKLVDSAQLDSDLTSVANAIRAKSGGSGQLAFPSGFVSEVGSIQTGITPTGTKQISVTQNGTTTEDVTNYASAEITVTVSGGFSADDIAYAYRTGSNLRRPGISGDVALTCSSIGFAAFAGTAITSIDAPNVTSETQLNTGGANWGGRQFSDCWQLKRASFPLLTSVGDCFFEKCPVLESVNLSSLTSAGSWLITGNNKLQVLVLPAYTGAMNRTIQTCTALKTVDLYAPTDIAKWNGMTFSGDSVLDTLIIRGSSVPAMNNINTFNGTPFASGGTGGTVYVPSALISSYEAATNWSTILGYANNHILPIEGSIYETQYADGTPIT